MPNYSIKESFFEFGITFLVQTAPIRICEGSHEGIWIPLIN